MSNKTIQISENDKVFIEAIANELNLSQKEALSVVIKQYRINEALKKEKVSSLESGKDVYVSPNEKIKLFVEAIMKHNRNAKNERDKVAITQSLISSETGCNRKNIKDYMTNASDEIEAHHESVYIDTSNPKALNLQFRNKEFFTKTDGKLDYIKAILEKEGIASIYGR